jgi:hypothetical protein
MVLVNCSLWARQDAGELKKERKTDRERERERERERREEL